MGKKRTDNLVTSVRAKGKRKKTGAMVQEPVGPPLPPLRSDASSIDYRTRFARLTSKERPPVEWEQAFIANRLKLLRTDSARHPADRESVVAKFKAGIAGAAALADDVPVPGGVGYGMFYNSIFKTAFATGTAISWEVICPTRAGGNVNTWLYQTATNRSSKGVEAFVSYRGQNDFTFNIFDWARSESERWRPPTALANLGKYIGTDSVHGIQLQVMAIMNTTYEQTVGTWVNEVNLFDVLANEWHLVYKFEYQASRQDQVGNWVGSWGPIVETFQDIYSNTNLMGALKTQIVSRDAAGHWGQWNQLTINNSALRTDNKGFVRSFLEPNHSWTIHS